MITNKVISFFTFGVFLIIIGVITNFFNWNQANLILAIGFVFELFALILFIYQKLKK